MEKIVRISKQQRLVPSSFSYGQEAMKRDVVCMQLNRGKSYPGYPRKRHRLKLSPEKYNELVAHGQLASFLVGTSERRPLWWADTKGRRQQDGKTLVPQAQDVYNLPLRSFPLHPFLREMLTDPRSPGVVAGPGYYWRLGANGAADSVVFREKRKWWQRQNRLQVLVVKGKDGRGWVLPGGEKSIGESGKTAAPREAIEETGINLGGLQAVPIRSNVIVGEWRPTANAWSVTDVWMFMLQGADQKVKGRDDAKKAKFMTVSRRNLRKMSFSHPNFVKLSVQKLEHQTGKVIKRNGKIGIAA